MGNDENHEASRRNQFLHAESMVGHAMQGRRPADYGIAVIATWVVQALLFGAIGTVLMFGFNSLWLFLEALFCAAASLLVLRVERRFRAIIPAGAEKYEIFWNKCRLPAIILIAIVIAVAFGTAGSDLSGGVGTWGLAITAVGIVVTIPRLLFGISIVRRSGLRE